MKVAALVLGILGGLAGLLGGTCALAVGGIGEALGAEGAEEVIGLGWLAFVAAIVGLIGAGVALPKPKISALLMAIAAVAGLIAVSFAYIFATVLFGIGALLAILGRNEKKSEA
jgi:hypothetical protein